MRVDPAFENYFRGRLHQVFLYVTDRCGLRCEQCLYKTTLADREMDVEAALELIQVFREYGAEKLTFIGGEPTLFGVREANRPLFDIIERARELGYRYQRLDSNGQFRSALLHSASFAKLDNLSFSLDGDTPEINDGLRGEGTFARSVRRLREALDLGYHATITTCVHPGNLHRLEAMIELAARLGAKELNFHPLFKMGIPRDEFSGDTAIDPSEWLEVYRALAPGAREGVYPLPVRLPQRFVETRFVTASPETYRYCPVRMGERVLVHPTGEIRICALCIGSPLHIARYSRNEVTFGAPNSEISEDRLARRPCMSQTGSFGDLTPLCISYKPFQSEFVWREHDFDELYVPTSAATLTGGVHLPIYRG